MKKQRKARSWWVVLWQSALCDNPDLLTYKTKKSAIDCNGKEKVFKVVEILPRKTKFNIKRKK